MKSIAMKPFVEAWHNLAGVFVSQTLSAVLLCVK